MVLAAAGRQRRKMEDEDEEDLVHRRIDSCVQGWSELPAAVKGVPMVL
jgi:hypothetical protein